MPLDETLDVGQLGHVADHESLHALNNSVGQPDGLAQLGADGKLLPAQSGTIEYTGTDGNSAGRFGFAPHTGDGAVLGQTRIYSELSTYFNDVALLVKGHADVRIERAPASNQSQLVTITGGPTGGTFTLTYGGQITAPLAYNISGAALQTALQALSTIGAGMALVYSASGGAPPAGGPWTISILTATPTALTGSGAALTPSGGITISQTVPDGSLFIELPIFCSSGLLDISDAAIRSRGSLGGNFDFRIINSHASKKLLFRNAANDTSILSVDDVGKTIFLGLLTIDPSGLDVTRITGGGSAKGFLFYGSDGGAGTSGIVRFRNNATDDATALELNTANGDITPKASSVWRGNFKVFGDGTTVRNIVIGDSANAGGFTLGRPVAAAENVQLMNVNNADIVIGTNNVSRLTVRSDGWLVPTDANSPGMILGTGTGFKFGATVNDKLAFYGTTPTAKQTGVAVTAAAIHAALVTLGLIAA